MENPLSVCIEQTRAENFSIQPDRFGEHLTGKRAFLLFVPATE